jgi:hypothetical protein
MLFGRGRLSSSIIDWIGVTPAIASAPNIQPYA